MSEIEIDNNPILIRATGKRNGISILIIGLISLCLSILLIAILPQAFFLSGLFLTSAAMVCVLIGFYKVREPEHSFVISKQALEHHHRRGKWVLEWQNIQRVDCPKIHRGLEHIELDMVGIKINDYEPFIEAISPMLVTFLLSEQRPLLVQGMSANCKTGACYEQDFVKETQFTLPSGKELTGVQAMFANRMKALRESLGFDVFISATDIDRPTHIFAALLRECRDSVSENEQIFIKEAS